MRALLVTALLVVAGCSLWSEPSSDTSVDPAEELARGGETRRIAVLPMAYRQGSDIRACDLCPDEMVLASTSEDSALLVTAFFYEQLSRHPRFALLPYQEVLAAAGQDMSSTLARLKRGTLDAVLVGALLELRKPGENAGSGPRPGAAIYAALLDSRSGRTLWSSFVDADEEARSKVALRWRSLVEGRAAVPARPLDIARNLVGRMVDEMAERVD